MHVLMCCTLTGEQHMGLAVDSGGDLKYAGAHSGLSDDLRNRGGSPVTDACCRRAQDFPCLCSE